MESIDTRSFLHVIISKVSIYFQYSNEIVHEGVPDEKLYYYDENVSKGEASYYYDNQHQSAEISESGTNIEEINNSKENFDKILNENESIDKPAEQDFTRV